MIERKSVLAPWTVITWLALIAFGFLALFSYELSTGKHAQAAPCFWPLTSRVKPDPDLFNLLLFAHPKCPCTGATLGELSAVMAQCEGKLAAHVLFLIPGGAVEGWERTSLWRAAQLIPGVRCTADCDGREAELFGAFTSGQALLYDPQCQLVFEGGITGARGHSGDNAGRAAVVSIVNGRSTTESITNHPVFGCPIRETDETRFPRSP